MSDQRDCCIYVPEAPSRFIVLSLALIMGWALIPDGTGMAEEPGATIIGRVMFKGPVPPHNEITVREDSKFCGPTVSIQTIRLQSDGSGLQQAVVSLGDMTTGPAAPPRIRSLRNEQCAFRERISVGRKGDSLTVQNLDPILHNVHGTFGKRTILNVAQVPGGRSFKKTMKYSGQLIIRCDKHEFMKAHVMVFPHPYFSITDEAGQFRIDSVPPGHHQITVWHETLGTMEKDIDLPAHGTVTVEFEFRQ